MKVCLIMLITLIIGIVVWFMLCYNNEKYLPCDTEVEWDNMDPRTQKYVRAKDLYINEKSLWAKKKMDHAVQAENLLLLKQFFEKHQINYFIDCGTLLGAVREKSLIQGDTDADVEVTQKDMKVVRENIHELEEEGFIPWRNKDRGFMALSLIRNGEYLDLYRHWPRFPFKLKEYPFLGTTFSVPAYPEDYLDEIYGSDWRTPSSSKPSKNWYTGMPKYCSLHGEGKIPITAGYEK